MFDAPHHPVSLSFSSAAFTVYPNPFHTVANIQFVLEKAAPVSLELLDESGKKIRNLVTGPFGTGLHEIVLDASGLNGNVFYVVLSVNGSSSIKKLISRK